MEILLVDSDSIIPNLALMKLSAWHKGKGDDVSFLKLSIPYFPSRKRTHYSLPDGQYDRTYCSVVFDGTMECLSGPNTIFGGSGYSLQLELPKEIEDLEPDYSLYPDNGTSYGFISRGCIRNCPFCKVPEKEGRIRQVNTIDRIVRHRKAKFMDNNFLALPNHKPLLEELIQKQIRCQFNQGLDIRLVNSDNSILLSRLNYMGEYIFAFDNWKMIKTIESRLQLLTWRKDWQFKFFVYAHPDMKIQNIVFRIEYLRQNKMLPYLMRDKACYYDPRKNFYADIASYCNQPHLFKKVDFFTYLVDHRHTRERCRNPHERIKESWDLYKEHQQ